MKTVYEKSVEGRPGITLPFSPDISCGDIDSGLCRKTRAELPQLSELDIVRHFTGLAGQNFSLDANFYPLGSCTMKYNLKILETAAALEGFKDLNPNITSVPGWETYARGALTVLYGLQESLNVITGMEATSLQPMAGAQGEFAGMLIISAYHRQKGNNKKYVIVPDESHGTNPASAAMAGYELITVATADNGLMDKDELRSKLNSEVAAVLMTCPNTLGIFNNEIPEISSLAHEHDALMYYDGANLNAIMGRARPGDMGFDVMHVNLHKTFGTPHGGGGPGAGPVGVKEYLKPFLPGSIISKNDDDSFSAGEDNSLSVGSLSPFFGNFAVLLKAYSYILLQGADGLKDVSDKAVLNANYIMHKLKAHYELPYERTCMHECVFSAVRQNKNHVHALDIAKYLIDRGIHPPTIYFPLIVKEALMIEPTETESKQSIDEFIAVMVEAAELAEKRPEILKNSPVSRTVGRLDEVRAARELDVAFQDKRED